MDHEILVYRHMVRFSGFALYFGFHRCDPFQHHQCYISSNVVSTFRQTWSDIRGGTRILASYKRESPLQNSLMYTSHHKTRSIYSMWSTFADIDMWPGFRIGFISASKYASPFPLPPTHTHSACAPPPQMNSHKTISLISAHGHFLRLGLVARAQLPYVRAPPPTASLPYKPNQRMQSISFDGLPENYAIVICFCADRHLVRFTGSGSCLGLKLHQCVHCTCTCHHLRWCV